MKKIFLIMTLFSFFHFCKANDIVLTADLPIVGVMDLGGKTLRFEKGGSVSGSGTLQNGSIDADFNLVSILGSGVTYLNMRPYNQFFSACWFGAKGDNSADNSSALQRAIDVCIHQVVPVPLFIPQGIYNYAQPLLIANLSGANYLPFSFHMFGASTSWSSRDITTLNFTGAASKTALAIQDGRGVEINNLKIAGVYKPPTTADNLYFLTKSAEYVDVAGACNDNYTGIVIDPVTSGASGGSIGIKVHDVFVTNFAVDFSISPVYNLNSQMLVFENIQVGDSKWGFKANSPQSRGNTVRGLYSAGRMHTLITIGGKSAGIPDQAGYWTFDKASVLNKCIRVFDISSTGYYAIKIKDFYCENIGSVGTILTTKSYPGTPALNVESPIYIEGCNFDFVLPSVVSAQVLLRTSDEFVKFESCSFRYFTGSYPTSVLTINHDGNPATFDNCRFSGTVQQNNALFIMY